VAWAEFYLIHSVQLLVLQFQPQLQKEIMEIVFPSFSTFIYI